MKVDDFCEQNNTNLTCYDTSQARIDVEYRIQAGVWFTCTDTSRGFYPKFYRSYSHIYTTQGRTCTKSV